MLARPFARQSALLAATPPPFLCGKCYCSRTTWSASRAGGDLPYCLPRDDEQGLLVLMILVQVIDLCLFHNNGYVFIFIAHIIVDEANIIVNI
jgi:hypothetical protein